MAENSQSNAHGKAREFKFTRSDVRWFGARDKQGFGLRGGQALKSKIANYLRLSRIARMGSNNPRYPCNPRSKGLCLGDPPPQAGFGLLAQVSVEFQIPCGGADAGNVGLSVAIEILNNAIGSGNTTIVQDGFLPAFP